MNDHLWWQIIPYLNNFDKTEIRVVFCEFAKGLKNCQPPVQKRPVSQEHTKMPDFVFPYSPYLKKNSCERCFVSQTESFLLHSNIFCLLKQFNITLRR